MTLPIPKPPVFRGNILEYPKWSSAFDALIEEDTVKPSHKLYSLGEYTTGKAQTMINGLLGLQTEDAYSRARNILKDRFDDPFKVYEAYRQKLWAWPVCSTATELLVQSLNSPFFPPYIGAEPGRAKEESRITCMRMFRTPPFFPQIGGKTTFGSIFQIWLVARLYKQQFLYSD